MREFGTGATRDDDDGKLDVEGFISPAVLRRYCEYLHEHRKTPRGVRAADNWQKGMPQEVYIKSLMRHTLDMWLRHRGESPLDPKATMEDVCCAIIFGASGWLFEELRKKDLRNEEV